MTDFSTFSQKLLALLACALLLGCASREIPPLDEAPLYVTMVGFTPFYSLGPLQVQGPDRTLPNGTPLRLLRREFGYSYVALAEEEGIIGYVPNESIVVAPPDVVARINRPPVEPSVGNGGRSSRSTPANLPPLPYEPLPDLHIGPEEFLPPLLIDDTDEEPSRPLFRL